ncbi:hypothetical protein MTR67_042778 [Solanum verrucosum]|uniref:Uncharacterized protein n=1 Tax=Solanum verrucosum TaxID=315347 RepID=A0AAF0UQ33_SOLVR|nr:hypothetical protein MTR67_042778 [Solanum verrucosum]
MPVDCLQLNHTNTSGTQQPGGFAPASSLSPHYRDWFKCWPKPYIQVSHSTRLTDIPDVVTGTFFPSPMNYTI